MTENVNPLAAALVLPPTPGTEAEVALMFATECLQGRYVHTTTLGWLMDDGQRWKPVADKTAREAARQWVASVVNQALRVELQARENGDQPTASAAASVAGMWRRYETAAKLSNLVSLASAIDGVAGDASDFDSHPDLLNTPSGVVELKTGDLLPYESCYKFTKMTGVAYFPGARHNDWRVALQAIPKDTLAYMQLRLGQAITGHHVNDDTVFFGTGGGANGKSTLYQGVMGAIGDYAVIVNEVLIGAESDKQHPTEIMDLFGARLALIEELPEGKHLSVRAIKNLTGSQLKGRRMHKDWLTFSSSHSLFVNANYLPMVSETDHGTWRRLLRLHFPYTFRKPFDYDRLAEPRVTDRRGDTGLRDRIKDGGNGLWEAILAWLVEGAVRWYQGDEDRELRSLGEPSQRVIRDSETWQERCNPLVAYAKEYLMPDPGRHVHAETVAANVNAFIEGRGHHRWSAPVVNERLAAYFAAQGVDVEKRKVKKSGKLSTLIADADLPPSYQAWVGLRWRTPVDDAETVENATGETAQEVH
ncbi:DNA primase family protein [Streptomyces olivochromogenes]|uniref:Phage protein n=1 Tax=Streptomyces olivochromogenes TaxID=1963 RepID=A0A250VF92_STROL|nr:phage/plasmid primase, P4 family [Streptomyces olivochromogenes]KUN47425.1 hypothetical protein AQJ27_10845 [Streptomyces olivochromogenes]GAX52841.1 phage protein [Streptomyces olivochromogenes]